MEFLKLLRSQWDRAAAAALTVGGLLALVLGWVGISGTTEPARQLPYIVSGAVGSIFALGCAATLWLSADLRDTWRKLQEVSSVLRSDLDVRDGPSGSHPDHADSVVERPPVPFSASGPRR